MSAPCSIYGLGLQANVPIAGLIGLSVARKVDVSIFLGPLPFGFDTVSDAEHCYVSPTRDTRGVPELRVSRLSQSRHFRFNYCDGTVIVVNDRGSQVWANWPEGATIEDTATYLLGPILGFVLRLRGITCLHASAIAIGDRAIAFVGPAGAGKSSMAAAFARLGYPVLTDDVAALVDRGDFFEVQPAYPRVRLWPESVKSLFGSEEALPRIVPNWDKRYLDLNGPGYRFQHDPLPLAATYYLDERSADPAKQGIEPLGTRTGLMALISNTYVTYLIDKTKRAHEFDALGRLIQSAPARRVTPSANPTHIEQLCTWIVDDFHRSALCTS